MFVLEVRFYGELTQKTEQLRNALFINNSVVQVAGFFVQSIPDWIGWLKYLSYLLTMHLLTMHLLTMHLLTSIQVWSGSMVVLFGDRGLTSFWACPASLASGHAADSVQGHDHLRLWHHV